MHKLLVVAVLLGVFHSPVFAQWAVLDAGNLVHNTVTAANAVLTAANTAKLYIGQAEQIRQTYNMILNQIKQIEWMVTNMQRLPKGLNMLDYISGVMTNIDGLLNAAVGLSQRLNDMTAQFDRLYRNVQAVVTAKDWHTLRKQLAGVRIDASRVSMQIATIRENLSQGATRMSALLSGSQVAKGALDNAQIAAQQTALLHQTQQTIAVLLAANQRVVAQAEAENAALIQQDVAAAEKAMADSVPYAGGNGQFTTYRW